MIRLRYILGALSLGLAINATAATSYERALAVTYQAGGISLEQAIVMVQTKYGAKVMKADRVEEGGRLVYYIRLTTQDRSRVWTVRVDAATGREF